MNLLWFPSFSLLNHWLQTSIAFCESTLRVQYNYLQPKKLSAYHSATWEPPLHVYLAMMIHNKTRNLNLIEKLSQLSLCVSKHWLQDAVCDVGSSLINTNEKYMIVVPTSLKVDFFPTASVANINLEKKSSLATTLLHRTASSISQHPTDSLFRTILSLSDSSKKLLELSQWQTDVVLFHLLNGITVPVLAPTSLPIVTSSTHAMNQP